MQYLIQDTKLNDNVILERFNSLKKLNFDIKPISINNNIISYYHDLTKPAFLALGSNKLVTCLNKEYPEYCVYDDEYFKYSNYCNYFDCLNKDFILYKIKDILELSFSKDVFIRPNKSNKLFNGFILKKNEKFKNIIKNNNVLFIEEEVLISSIKNILSEYRFFIVDEKIITGRQYIKDKKIHIDYVDKNTYSYVNECIKNFTYLKMFVLDIAKVNSSYFVLELNCINSSGSYNHNLEKLYQSINIFLNKNS